ncbi:SUKH-4 family immunity protein [Streptomyces sp. 2132.2]|uniref:SUKH-4 family immunity protein n=1 Tax=Streptomyces sp. 2132.2 TaxID=2485161 RepID=UPI000F4A4835|nr:SUKH-4 family immunity protein [Streptomyces sp. 2132.2]
MLFDVDRGELAGIFGEDRLASLPATAFPPDAADTEGARLLRTVGVPTGTLLTDVSSLVQVTLLFQRRLDEFTFSGDEADGESEFERLEREVERIRQETGGLDPLPFRDDDTLWSVVGEEIAAGRRFTGDSPGARSLCG